MAQKADILCIGVALVDSIIRGFDPEPVSASGYRAVSGSLKVGGEAVNHAVAAARLGMKAEILCSLGADSAGDMVLAYLNQAGVNTDLVIRAEEHPTPVTTMFVREDGTRKSITNLAHRYNFHPEQYASCFSGTRAVVLGSLFRAPFDDPGIIFSVLRAAREVGASVFADTKLPNFNVLALDDLKEALPLIILTCTGSRIRMKWRRFFLHMGFAMSLLSWEAGAVISGMQRRRFLCRHCRLMLWTAREQGTALWPALLLRFFGEAVIKKRCVLPMHAGQSVQQRSVPALR